MRCLWGLRPPRSTTRKLVYRRWRRQFPPGVVAIPDGDPVVTPSCGADCIFTSLGTMTPLRCDGVAGRPPSADVATEAGVCGGGSLTVLGPQPHSHATPASAIRCCPACLVVIPVT